MRVVVRMQGRVFVCTTGADSPAIYYLHVTIFTMDPIYKISYDSLTII